MAKTRTAEAAKPFVRYCRVSRVGGRSGDGYISVPEQVRTVDRLAREHGVDVLPDLYRDEDRSGGSLDRPEFQRGLELVRAGKAGGLIVATFDRFSRDVSDALTTVREIEALGGRLICGDGDVSVSNGNDAFMTTVRAAVSAFERSRRAEYLDKSVRNAIERGVHLQAPFGYRKSNGTGSRLAVNPDEAPLVRAMFELRAAGHSWPTIAKAANESGPPPRPYRRDGRLRQGSWNHKAIRQIVTSETYRGVAHNGQRRHEDAHDAIITDKLWTAANHARGTRWVGPTDGYALTGLARCSQCGHTLIRSSDSYRCRDAQGGDCPGTTVPAAALEHAVADEFKARYRDIEVAAVTRDPAADETEQAIARSKRALGGMIELAGTLDDMSASERQVFDERLAAERDRLAGLEGELRAAQRGAVAAELPDGLDLDGFDGLPVAEQRRLLGVVFACVAVRPGRVWREAVPDRIQIIGREQAPTDSTGLIELAAGLDW